MLGDRSDGVSNAMLSDSEPLETLCALYRTDSRMSGFDTPWSARAFAIVIALTEKGICTRHDFQSLLIAELALREADVGPIQDEASYYACWIGALSKLLLDQKIILPGHLDRSESAVMSKHRNMEEAHTEKRHHTHCAVRSTPRPVYREVGL